MESYKTPFGLFDKFFEKRKTKTSYEKFEVPIDEIKPEDVGKSLHPFRDMDYPIYGFSNNPVDFWTLEDAVRGTQIFGGIGSGKSTGSGKAIALSFLRSGFGGVVLCGKKDELNSWLSYAKETGREDDLIIFNKNSGHEFNPFLYELNRTGEGAGETSNLVNLLMSINQLGQRINGSEAKESERFWEIALKRCLSRTIDLLKLSDEDLSMSNMIEIISSAPSGENFYNHIAGLDAEEEKEWSYKSYCTKCIHYAAERDDIPDGMKEEHLAQVLIVANYFLRDLALLTPETRTGVIESALGILEPFQSGILAKQFARGVNIYPESTQNGKIIILDYKGGLSGK